LSIQRDAARSRICFGSIEGCASKSKPESSLTAGKCAASALQLLARRRLEPHGRQRLRLQRLPIGLNRPLQGAPADRQALLGSQVLVNDIRIAAVPDEPLAQPNLVPSSSFGRCGDLNGLTPPATT
jgi:hypothetical protein